MLRLPVPPSTGNFFEAGFSKGLFGKLRLDANWYRRSIDDFADDDVLVNTGVSFPIAFRKALIHGVEIKLDIPRWGPLSGSVGYSNLTGVRVPSDHRRSVAGRRSSEPPRRHRPVCHTQDQRNTLRGRLRYQVASRVWVAFGGSYGSGLPVEFEGTRALAAAEYGERIVDRVNFDRGRLRPSLAFDASAGVEIWKREEQPALAGGLAKSGGPPQRDQFRGSVLRHRPGCSQKRDRAADGRVLGAGAGYPAPPDCSRMSAGREESQIRACPANVHALKPLPGESLKHSRHTVKYSPAGYDGTSAERNPLANDVDLIAHRAELGCLWQGSCFGQDPAAHPNGWGNRGSTPILEVFHHFRSSQVSMALGVNDSHNLRRCGM